jgi:putative membrane protein
MTEAVSPAPRASISDHLAVERTFLAWIRTGLSLMGFGFVVARFGLFLQELQVIRPSIQMRSNGLSLWFGTALILIGVVVNVLSSMHYLRLVRHLRRGETDFSGPSGIAIGVALFLALIGLAMAIYLVFV